MPRHEELTEEQWEVLRSLIPEPRRRSDGRGRPWRANREVLNGILWILRTGAPWKDLPERFPPYQTCHRRFQQWARTGLMKSILEALAADLRARGRIDLSECFIDGSFASARGGGSMWVPPSGARARSSWRWQTPPVFLSPPPHALLRRTKSAPPTTPSSRGPPRSLPND